LHLIAFDALSWFPPPYSQRPSDRNSGTITNIAKMNEMVHILQNFGRKPFIGTSREMGLFQMSVAIFRIVSLGAKQLGGGTMRPLIITLQIVSHPFGGPSW